MDHWLGQRMNKIELKAYALRHGKITVFPVYIWFINTIQYLLNTVHILIEYRLFIVQSLNSGSGRLALGQQFIVFHVIVLATICLCRSSVARDDPGREQNDTGQAHKYTDNDQHPSASFSVCGHRCRGLEQWRVGIDSCKRQIYQMKESQSR